MNKEIIDRLKWVENGEWGEHEYWEDRETGKVYWVPIRVVYHWDAIEEVIGRNTTNA